LGEDLRKISEVGDVANKPQKIGIQEHNFSAMLVQVAEAGLAFELVVIRDAGR
jgi:hypothetical protein